jgi:hypothetical protein
MDQGDDIMTAEWFDAHRQAIRNARDTRLGIQHRLRTPPPKEPTYEEQRARTQVATTRLLNPPVVPLPIDPVIHAHLWRQVATPETRALLNAVATAQRYLVERGAYFICGPQVWRFEGMDLAGADPIASAALLRTILADRKPKDLFKRKEGAKP